MVTVLLPIVAVAVLMTTLALLELLVVAAGVEPP